MTSVTKYRLEQIYRLAASILIFAGVSFFLLINHYRQFDKLNSSIIAVWMLFSFAAGIIADRIFDVIPLDDKLDRLKPYGFTSQDVASIGRMSEADAEYFCEYFANKKIYIKSGEIYQTKRMIRRSA